MRLSSILQGLRFSDPLWLLAMVAVGVLAWLTIRRQRRTAILYSDASLLANLPMTWAMRVKRRLPWVRVAGLVLIVLALARPQAGQEEFRLRTEGVAIEMCIDRSGSMQALDFELDGKRVDRLAMVKRVFRDFIEGQRGLRGRPDDLVGLVAFGGFAEAKCPLTLDHGALLQVLDTVQIPQPLLDSNGQVINQRLIEEDQATAIGDAVTLAVDRLKDCKAKSRVVILLSDGEQNAGIASPQDGAKAAKKYGVKVYSIGIGTTGTVPFPMKDNFGRVVLRPVQVRMDEKTLQSIAQTTGARYYNAQDTESLRKICEEIDQLERTPTEGQLYTSYNELYRHLLFPGMLLVLLEVVLSCTRFRSLP